MGNCKEDEAIEILALVRSNGDEKDPAVIMIKYINNRAQNSYWVMFIGWWSGKLNFMRQTQLALWLQTLMQIGTGIAATTIYLPTLFTDAGWGGNKAQWLAALNAIVGVLGTTVSAFIRDPLGTRRMLFIDAARQSACMFLSGGMARLTQYDPAKAFPIRRRFRRIHFYTHFYFLLHLADLALLLPHRNLSQ
ncbi:hypothetical protein ABVK25_006885 [Lepraria finkii]|uniref:Uncharacterized protein n=1 Tax=Lepraria finkii TaxID=1340010 RepID=A0ABR4B523_9LECA